MSLRKNRCQQGIGFLMVTDNLPMHPHQTESPDRIFAATIC